MSSLSRWPLSFGLCLLLLVSPLNAEIQVPPKSQPYKPIVITVQPANVPEGAQVRGSVVCETAELLPGPSNEVWHCWAAPGTHLVKASGVWVQTRNVQIDGQTVPVLVDFGAYTESATFVVGEGVEPNPTPVPPPGERWLIIVEESSQRTAQQANLYNELRADKTAKILIADQHDSSELVRRYVAQIPDGTYLPVAVVVDQSGKVVRIAALPDTVSGVKELLK